MGPWGFLQTPAFWVGSVLVGFLTSLAATYAYQFQNPSPTGSEDVTLAARALPLSKYHLVQTFITAATAVHAILAGVSFLIIFAIKSHDEFVSSLFIIVLAGVVSMGILWLGRLSPAAALAQLVTFGGLFIWVTISQTIMGLDMVPVYGVLAGVACGLIFFYTEAYSFLIARTGR